MSTKNPWQTVSSTVTYQNPWFRVREDQVIRPDGKPGIYGVVETRIATGVAALTPENELYLVGQYRYPTEEYSWEIIEGGADPGELPIEAAKRELREEAGLVAAEVIPLGSEIHLSNCITAERAYLFVARGLSSVPAAPDGTEVLSVRKVPFVEAVRMVESGEIKDGMTIIAILRLLLENRASEPSR
jgi:8-oxo-dGTP pyrophosphatase MutT (NUDIX family)